jgi:transposase
MAKRYTEEFKQEAAQLYRSSGKGYRVLAEELGVSAYSLRLWVQRYTSTNEVTLSEREELRKLRRENRVLREEREILRKAAAFFAKETNSNR